MSSDFVSDLSALWPGPALLMALATVTVALVLALGYLALNPRPRRPRTLLQKFEASVAASEGVEAWALEWLPQDQVSCDRRQASRRAGRVTPVLVASQPDGPAEDALVLDRSTGGLCLAVDRPVPEGGPAFVRASGGPWVELDVRHCRPHAGYFLVGGAFRRPQPWAVVLLFG